MRTLYVAATRARDLLVVPVMADGPIDGWVTPLTRAVYSAAASARARPCRSGRRVVPSCAANASSGAPAGSRRVARPRAVRACIAPSWARTRSSGGRRDELRAAGRRGRRSAAAEASRRRRARRALGNGCPCPRCMASGARAGAGGWQPSRWCASRRRPSTPRPRPAKSTCRSRMRRCPACARTARRFGIAGARRAGRRSTSAPIAPPWQRRRRCVGRLLGATPDEVAAATEVVVHALAHPLLRRAAAAASCRRETAVLLRLADGTLVEGVVDAAFAEGDGLDGDRLQDRSSSSERGWRNTAVRSRSMPRRSRARPAGRPAPFCCASESCFLDPAARAWQHDRRGRTHHGQAVRSARLARDALALDAGGARRALREREGRLRHRHEARRSSSRSTRTGTSPRCRTATWCCGSRSPSTSISRASTTRACGRRTSRTRGVPTSGASGR